MINVAHSDVFRRSTSCGKVNHVAGLEGSVSVAQHHAERRPLAISTDQIEFAVVVKVAGCQPGDGQILPVVLPNEEKLPCRELSRLLGREAEDGRYGHEQKS